MFTFAKKIRLHDPFSKSKTIAIRCEGMLSIEAATQNGRIGRSIQAWILEAIRGAPTEVLRNFLIARVWAWKCVQQRPSPKHQHHRKEKEKEEERPLKDKVGEIQETPHSQNLFLKITTFDLWVKIFFSFSALVSQGLGPYLPTYLCIRSTSSRDQYAPSLFNASHAPLPFRFATAEARP